MGIAIMVMWLISIPLVFVFGIGLRTGLATWIASAVLGYTMTRDGTRPTALCPYPGNPF